VLTRMISWLVGNLLNDCTGWFLVLPSVEGAGLVCLEGGRRLLGGDRVDDVLGGSHIMVPAEARFVSCS
jgi:hypothetical protein